jgi:hypothetical protein
LLIMMDTDTTHLLSGIELTLSPMAYE